MKCRLQLVALLLLATLFLSGCWSRVELNDLAIVSTIILDREQSGALRISLQLVIPQRITRPGGPAPGKNPVDVVSATGETILDAARKLQLMLPRRLFWSHANVILLGERLARSGLDAVEDFLTRYREIRMTSYLLVIRGDPLDMLELIPPLERIPMEAIRELEHSQTGLVVQLREYVQMRQLAGVDPALPWLGAVSNTGRPGEPDTRFRLQGTALFKGSQVVGWLDSQETRGLMWLRGQPMRGIITVPADHGRASMEIAHSSTERRILWQQGKPRVDLLIKIEGALQEVEAPIDTRNPAAVAALERAVAFDVRQRIVQTFTRTSQMGVDPSGFGWSVHRSNPGYWRSVASTWRQQVRNLPVEVRVEVHIRMTGLTNRPMLTPNQELK